MLVMWLTPGAPTCRRPSYALVGATPVQRVTDGVVERMVTDTEPYPEELGGLDEATEALDTDERLDRYKEPGDRVGMDEPRTDRTGRGGSQLDGSDKPDAESGERARRSDRPARSNEPVALVGRCGGRRCDAWSLQRR